MRLFLSLDFSVHMDLTLACRVRKLRDKEVYLIVQSMWDFENVVNCIYYLENIK